MIFVFSTFAENYYKRVLNLALYRLDGHKLRKFTAKRFKMTSIDKTA